MSLRKTLAGFVLSVGLGLTAAQANATPELGLWLAIDGSGSISDADFALQKNAYVNVLNKPGVVPLDGSVAIGVSQFDDTLSLVIDLTTVNSAADLTLITDAIAGMTQLGGWTAIGSAIDDAAARLLAFESGLGEDIELLIDVSTDGQSNRGLAPGPVASAAVAAGIDQINCLGVGAAADCSFIAGDGAFSVSATTFADFEDALQDKIEGEIPPSVPEPTSALVFGAGFLLVARSLRRSRR